MNTPPHLNKRRFKKPKRLLEELQRFKTVKMTGDTIFRVNLTLIQKAINTIPEDHGVNWKRFKSAPTLMPSIVRVAIARISRRDDSDSGEESGSPSPEEDAPEDEDVSGIALPAGTSFIIKLNDIRANMKLCNTNFSLPEDALLAKHWLAMTRSQTDLPDITAFFPNPGRGREEKQEKGDFLNI